MNTNETKNGTQSGSAVARSYVRHVRQPNNWGCGLACVAMIAGVDYSRVEQMAGPGLPTVKEGTTPPLLWALLSHLGFSVRLLHRTNCDEWPVWCADVHIVEVRRATGGHWVVWNGQNVLDPAREGTHPLSDYKIGSQILAAMECERRT